MKKIFAGVILASFVLMSPLSVGAQTASTTASAQVQSLLAQIQNLQAQIKALQDLQAQIKTAQTNIASTLTLVRNLREGMSGSDVTTLQTILASDPSIYPQGVVSGYFGKMTSEAVKKFQKKYGIESVGLAGPKTLKKLNEVMKELGLEREDDNDSADTNHDKKLCIPPGHMIAKGWLKKNDKPVPTSLIPLCNNRYDDDDDNGISATTTPNIIATSSPSVMVGGIISSSALLRYGNNPTGTITFQVYGPNDATCASPLTPALSSVTVNGNGYYNSGNFTTTTVGTYKFIATYSGDSKNYSVHTNCNAVGSTVNITAVPDTTAPIISALVATPAATTTNVSWTTDELTNSKVWFGTTNPLSLASSTLVSLPTLVTGHSVPLSDLATSTTYNFVVVSADNSGNTATSSQSSFTTLAQ